MSVASASVNVQVRFGADALRLLQQLTEDAIQRAIQATVARIRAYALSGQANVPRLTGQLQDSFDIGSTPRSIVFKWSALSPTGYDYAKIQDVGGKNRYGYIAGKYYSSVTTDYARQWLVEELMKELGRLRVP